MASIKPLLTIAIPTYNRSNFLDTALSYIFIQIKDKNYPLELIVSDNCSSDNTSVFVQKYIDKGLTIRYIKNVENKGPDFNIAQCFNLAQGKFVLILGDDDILIEGSISKIIHLLIAEPDIGILHITGKEYDKNNNLIGIPVNSNKYQLYNYQLDFLKKIHYNFTFISGNILNKSLIRTDLEVMRFNNTNLIQLGWTFHILLLSKKNIYLEDDLLGIGSVQNTGGYKLFEVFAINFNKIMNSFKFEGFNTKYINVINNNLIMSFFPGFIFSARNSDRNSFDGESLTSTLKDQYKNNFLYWIYIAPLITLPRGIAQYWLYFLNLLNRCVNRITRIGFNRKRYIVKTIDFFE